MSILVALVAASLCGAGCRKEEPVLFTDPFPLIPAEITGVYGRSAEDSPGLTVTATGLEFGEMRLTIHAGKLEGDTVRIEHATLAWKKLEPKTCTGTLSRHKDRLLMTLYQEVGTEQRRCEPLLDAQWFAWEPLAELPEMLRGRYNVVSIAANELRIELDWFEARMLTDKIHRLPGDNDERVELLIEEGRVVHSEPGGEQDETVCTGTVTLEDGWLSTAFWVPARFGTGFEQLDAAAQAEWDEHVRTCKDWNGRAQKFEVSMDALPRGPISKAGVSLAISPTKVVLDSPALRCEQELWRTQTVSTRPGVFGGERMTLGKAEPTQVSDGCRLNMRIACERREGNDTSMLDTKIPASEAVQTCMAELERELCPSAITVQAISDLRYQFAVEPFSEAACVDTTGDFRVTKPD